MTTKAKKAAAVRRGQEDVTNLCFRQMWPSLLEASRASDRGDFGKVSAWFLMAEASIIETLGRLERLETEAAE